MQDVCQWRSVDDTDGDLANDAGADDFGGDPFR